MERGDRRDAELVRERLRAEAETDVACAGAVFDGVPEREELARSHPPARCFEMRPRDLRLAQNLGGVDPERLQTLEQHTGQRNQIGLHLDAR